MEDHQSWLPCMPTSDLQLLLESAFPASGTQCYWVICFKAIDLNFLKGDIIILQELVCDNSDLMNMTEGL